ncbi:MAG: hypothetical protein ACKN9K_08680, partial [Dolichospermum sp.]
MYKEHHTQRLEMQFLMYANYSAAQFESLSLAKDPNPEEVETDLIETPALARTSSSPANSDGGIYLVQRGGSLASQKSE